MRIAVSAAKGIGLGLPQPVASIGLPVGMAQITYGDILPWGMLMAASLLISVPVMIFYMFGQRFMIAGLTTGSVKG